MKSLQEIAKQMVESPKGILAADESTGTMTKRLTSIGVESTLENRNTFRSIIFGAPDLNKYISGVILYDETFRNKDLTKQLTDQGILLGIKVDQGTTPFNNESITLGLEGLWERLKEYKSMGASFTKWRAVITPNATQDCITKNAVDLAAYATFSQMAGLVPIVEPEVLMDGNHTIITSRVITELTLKEVFYQLRLKKVHLDGIVLKPNMVLSGYSNSNPINEETVAQNTLRCLLGVVPSEVPGIAFLSGGQTDEVATKNLNEINRMGKDAPWRLTFSFGRGLQQAALKAWMGKEENRSLTQDALIKQAKLCSSATIGVL